LTLGKTGATCPLAASMGTNDPVAGPICVKLPPM